MSTTETKYFVQMSDGKTSYQINEDDYKNLKKILLNPKDYHDSFELNQQKHNKIDNLFETRIIVVSQILSLTKQDPEETVEPKDYTILFVPVEMPEDFQKIYEKYSIQFSKKNYNFWLDQVNQVNNDNEQKVINVDLGSHGIPTDVEMWKWGKNCQMWFSAPGIGLQKNLYGIAINKSLETNQCLLLKFNKEKYEMIKNIHNNLCDGDTMSIEEPEKENISHLSYKKNIMFLGRLD